MEDRNFENDPDIKIVKEKKILVTESRIRNTIKEYKKGQPLGWLLSTSLACFLSFFTAFASYSSYDNGWKWSFLFLAIFSALVFSVSGVISVVRKKYSRGTEKWFIEEIRDEHPYIPKKQIDTKKRKRTIFNIINVVMLIAVPGSGYLIFLASNDWKPYPNELAGLFWMIWSMFSLAYLIFGTSLNAIIAYVLFGYDKDDE